MQKKMKEAVKEPYLRHGSKAERMQGRDKQRNGAVSLVLFGEIHQIQCQFQRCLCLFHPRLQGQSHTMIGIQTHYSELDLVMKQGCTSIDCPWSHLQENLLEKGYQKQAYYPMNQNQNPFEYCP